jgi:surfeit locus 1 family protein
MQSRRQTGYPWPGQASSPAGYRSEVTQQSVSPRSVVRTALRPRWLGVLAVVLLLCVAFTWLGHWQLDVARSKEKPKHPKVVATAPIDQVVRPQQTFRNNMVARPVTVSGEYDAGKQLLVSGKRLGGVDGFWVLTALRVPSGALVPVVRGFVPSANAGATAGSAAALAPPTGPVALRGVLEPPDSAPADGDSPDVPAGQIPAADTADVVNLWGSPIYNVLVYVVATGPAASTAGSVVRLQPVPAPPANQGGGLDLRNAAYAVQWWIFGLFALLLWWRMVRQDAVETAMAAAVTPQETKELSTP